LSRPPFARQDGTLWIEPTSDTIIGLARPSGRFSAESVIYLRKTRGKR
jgi:hypothetical protein